MQYQCPYCSGVFETGGQAGASAISCPHCRGVVQLGPPATHPVYSAPAASSAWPPAGKPPPAVSPVTTSAPPVVVTASVSPKLSRRIDVPQESDNLLLRSERKSQQRAVKNAIMWVTCALALLLLLWFLMSQEPG